MFLHEVQIESPQLLLRQHTVTWSVHAKSKATQKSSSSTTTWLFVDIFPFLEFSRVLVLVNANDCRKKPWFLCFHTVILSALEKIPVFANFGRASTGKTLGRCVCFVLLESFQY